MALSAKRSTPIPPAALLCFLFLSGLTIEARRPATYIVGGKEFGWDATIPMDTWTRGKRFYAGDILVFNYDDQLSNVVVVNRMGYDNCTPNDGAKFFDSGHDRLALAFGDNYYIGTVDPAICAGGLKMHVYAHAPPRSSSAQAPERS